ncbi:MAG: DUF5671 domain-containing protein [Acidimicrobiia bacterium]
MRVVLPVVFLGLIAALLVAIARRILGRREGSKDGNDILVYLLLAVAVGVATFSLAQLARAAFPGAELVFGSGERVATALAGLVVSMPFVVYLWRRQSERRRIYPEAAGWTLYLAAIEAVFLTSAVIAAIEVLRWLIGDDPRPDWTNVIVYGGVVAYHHWVARQSPPRSDAAELPRIIGSAVGLVPASIGLGGLFFWLLELVYSRLTPIVQDAEPATSLAFLLVGGAVWAYRWLPAWPGEPQVPRLAWTTGVSIVSLAATIGALVAVVIDIFTYLLPGAEAAGDHFSALPLQLAIAATGALIWTHHRRLLGAERTQALRAYGYVLAAIGLGTAIGSGTALVTAVFDPGALVEPSAEDAGTSAIVLLAAVLVWHRFWSQAVAAPREFEVGSLTRRIYLLGMGVVTGLTSAGALIAVLVVIFRRLLSVDTGDGLMTPLALAVFSGLAAWHLLRTHNADRQLLSTEEVVTPYAVTVICSHPGVLATRFPEQATLTVIYRDDAAGVINDAMADEIVTAVNHRSSVVWVDQDGFRVAPLR